MAIEVKNITKRYGCKEVLSDVSLTIKHGCVTSFIGGNGAGKSTLLSIISRLIPADEGQVILDGKPLSQYQDIEVAKRIAILKQSNHVNLRLSVEDLVAFGRFPYSKGHLNAHDKEEIEKAINFMELDEIRLKFLDELSGGQRQRAFIAMVIAQDTDYILLDEPLNNLDMRHAAQMMQILRRMAKSKGKAVVLVIHDINFASVYSDEIFALKEGKLTEYGPPSHIMQEPVLFNIFDFKIPVHKIDGHRLGIYFNSSL